MPRTERRRSNTPTVIYRCAVGEAASSPRLGLGFAFLGESNGTKSWTSLRAIFLEDISFVCTEKSTQI